MGDEPSEVLDAGRTGDTSKATTRFRTLGWLQDHDAFATTYYAIALLVAFAILAILVLSSLTKPMLATVLPPIAFAICVLTFAVLYFRRYLLDRTSFHFSGGISTRQASEIERRLSRELASQKIVERVLDEACRTGNDGVLIENLPIPDKGWFATRRTYWKVTTSSGYTKSSTSPPSRLGTSASVTVVSNSPYVSETFTFAADAISQQNLIDHHTRCLGYVRRKREALEERVASLTGPRPDIWNFGDFLYFSLITQTTVGYGDILPNCSYVRALVSAQVLLGYLILGTFFAMIFAT